MGYALSATFSSDNSDENSTEENEEISTTSSDESSTTPIYLAQDMATVWVKIWLPYGLFLSPSAYYLDYFPLGKLRALSSSQGSKVTVT
jgi:hypothetical protein